MTNLEHYEKELKENGRDERLCTMFGIREDLDDEEDERDFCNGKCDECFIKSIKWFGRQYHEPVLTREEKRYLKSVLAPFETSGGRIVKRGEEIDPIISIDREGQRYPYFSILILHLINIEFKFDGLNFNHVYSFEELGL